MRNVFLSRTAGTAPSRFQRPASAVALGLAVAALTAAAATSGGAVSGAQEPAPDSPAIPNPAVHAHPKDGTHVPGPGHARR